MSYNILGINTSHNGSVCVLSDGEIDFFLEEDRITRIKHDSIPLKLLSYISSKYYIDEIAISGLYTYPFEINERILEILIRKFFPKTKITYYLNNHHLTHASISFSNSKFKDCLCLVVDGSGTEFMDEKGNIESFETESIYKFSYEHPPTPIYKSYRNNKGKNDLLTFTKVYENITLLNFTFHISY